MKIMTKRLNIRYVQENDFEDMIGYMSDEIVMKYESQSYTREGLEKFLKEVVPLKCFYAVINNKTDQLIGHVYLGKTNPETFNEYNVGYIFNPIFHRQGYCTEATKALCEYAFDVLHAHRLTAKCNPENIASWRVMEKVGFLKEGLLRSRVSFKYDALGNPIHTDELIYGMLREDLV